MGDWPSRQMTPFLLRQRPCCGRLMRCLPSRCSMTSANCERIPFESTTLQRREGYREILLAWLMLDAAAQLDWPGREDAYDGTTRDVATLYEFWLYFLLVRAFRDRLGMVPEQDPLRKG